MIMGKRVRKGETIGYVGMTGLATGPHLDFRISHHGTYINPVKLEDSTRKFYTKKGTGKSRAVSRG
jgi:murein DD-endopeptidase MepM/ murein hydrolase activator NlpD